jgi:drug/metabolite transporter (DMT)-like permease
MGSDDWIRLLTLSLLWGGSFFFVELALTAFAAPTLVWLRVALAGLVLWAVLHGAGLPLPPPATWPALVVMGGLNNAVPFTLIAWAQGEITGALASVLNATTPLMTVIVAHVATTDERLTAAKAAGLLCGFAGVTLLLAAGGFSGNLSAMLACLAAAAFYALAGVFGRRFRRLGLKPVQTAFGQLVAAAVLMLPFAALDPTWRHTGVDAAALAGIAGLAVLSTALAYVLYFRILATAGATNLALVTFLIPVSATLLGGLFLGERLGLRDLAAFALIATGLIFIDGRGWTWLTGHRAAR